MSEALKESSSLSTITDHLLFGSEASFGLDVFNDSTLGFLEFNSESSIVSLDSDSTIAAHLDLGSTLSTTLFIFSAIY